MNRLPQAKNSNVIQQELGTDLLVYDLSEHQAFCLNETSAAVWLNCDGKTTFDDLKRKVKGLNDELILMALKDLQKQHLLQDEIEINSSGDKLSRRKALLKYGSLAIALPVIIAIVAPTAVHAQSSCIKDGLGFQLNSTDVRDCTLRANYTRCCSSSIQFTSFDGINTVTCVCGTIVIL